MRLDKESGEEASGYSLRHRAVGHQCGERVRTGLLVGRHSGRGSRAGRHVPGFAGQDRFRDARVDPPEVLYVDRDCCGPNYVGHKFEDWGTTQVSDIFLSNVELCY